MWEFRVLVSLLWRDRVVVVRGEDGLPSGDLLANERPITVLSLGHPLHLVADLAVTCTR